MAAGLPNLKVSRRVECAWRLLLEHTCDVFHFLFCGALSPARSGRVLFGTCRLCYACWYWAVQKRQVENSPGERGVFHFLRFSHWLKEVGKSGHFFSPSGSPIVFAQHDAVLISTSHSSAMHRPLVFCLVVVLLAIAASSSAVPRKPVWPRQFDVQFGLSVVESPLNGPIVNVTSHFYYDFNVQASLVTYPELCLPGLIPVPPPRIISQLEMDICIAIVDLYNLNLFKYIYIKNKLKCVVPGRWLEKGLQPAVQPQGHLFVRPACRRGLLSPLPRRWHGTVPPTSSSFFFRSVFFVLCFV